MKNITNIPPATGSISDTKSKVSSGQLSTAIDYAKKVGAKDERSLQYILKSLKAVPVTINDAWVNVNTRIASKYAPVKVTKSEKGYDASMEKIRDFRISQCMKLRTEGTGDKTGWFSFIRDTKASEDPGSMRITKGKQNVPLIVLSGGSAKKIAADIKKDFSLAWHPKNAAGELVYLMVHKLDYENYAKALGPAMEKYPNLNLIGWNSGKLTGFGAARSAAMAFASSLPSRPQQVLLMDQDVVKTEDTRHTRPDIQSKLLNVHKAGSPIVSVGVGYPTRVEVPKPFSKTPKPLPEDFNSPVQQAVSIKAPFDGIYPPYMVSGGEDMLVGFEKGLIQSDKNVALLDAKIIKKALRGEPDDSNLYWNQARIETLKELYEGGEKNIQLKFENEVLSMDQLLTKFAEKGWISSHPSPESYNVSASIVERIILRYAKNHSAKKED